jgi:KaiC/GvpD/RAD55 family RecA-like ATPase/transcriptional regulator with XRE-family HTH domain
MARSEILKSLGNAGPWPKILVSALESKNWSQRQLAQYLQRDQSTVSLYCAGRTVPRLSDRTLIRSLAEFLGLTTSDLEKMILAHRPAITTGSSLRRIMNERELHTVIDQDISGELKALWTRGVPRAFRGRLRELGFEYADSSQLDEMLLADAGDTSLPDLIPHDLQRLREKIEGDPNRGRQDALNAYGRLYDRNLQVRDAVRAACATLNAHFAAAESNTLSHKFVLDLITDKFSWCPEGERKAHVAALLGVLLQIPYLEKIATPPSLKRRWLLSPSFVTNRWFGYRVHVPRLNFLLDGGILLPTDRGLVLLTAGRPGTGKTMLNVQIIASLVRQGFVGIYLAAEEHPNSLIEKLSYIGYQRATNTQAGMVCLTCRDDSIPVWSTGEIPEPNVVSGHDQRGCLILGLIPDRRHFLDPESDILRLVKDVLSAASKSGKRTVIAIDSIDAIASSNTGADSRRQCEKLFNFARNHSTLALFVGEKYDLEGTPGPAEYLTDIHFYLGSSNSRPATRTLTITKSRHQSIVRGEHPYAIHSERGFECYPSIQARLSISRRRIRPAGIPQTVRWSLRDLNFDDVLQGNVVEGDSILLHGPSTTYKLLVGLSFIASGLRHEPDSDVLLISLRQDLSGMLRVISAHPQIAEQMLKPQALPVKLDHRVRFLHSPPDYFSAARFLEWTRDVFRSVPVGRRISRVLVHTVDQFMLNSPLISDEPLFFGSLIEYFKANTSSSLFVMSGNVLTIDLFNTVLSTKPLEGGEVEFRVSYTPPCNASPDSYRLLHRDGYLQLKPKLPGMR